MKTLALINKLNYYECAIKGFDRLSIAECREKSAKPALKATLCSIRKKSLLSKFRRIEQINKVALNSGFFIAVLRRYNSAKVGVTDRVNILQALMAGCDWLSKYQSDATRKDQVELIGFCNRAVMGF